MISLFSGRALAFVVLTAILASISGFAAYQLRPLAEAVAVVAVSDGELEELIPGLIPDFTYTVPAADGVAAWLEDNAVGSAETVITDDHELKVMVQDRDASHAVLRTQQLTDRVVSFFDNYRRDLIQNINAWFDAETAEWNDVLAAGPPKDEQKLLDSLKTALIDALPEGCLQDVTELENVGRSRAGIAETVGGGDASVDGQLWDQIGSYRMGPVAAYSCQSLTNDLDKLLAVPSVSENSFARAVTMRSTLVSQKVELMLSEAWGKPVAWVKTPAVTAERPAWAALPLLISGCLVLSMLAAGLMMSLYALLAVLWRGRGASGKDGSQVFNDPHWPARVP